MVYFRRSGNYNVSADIVNTYQKINPWLSTLTYHVSGRPLKIVIPNSTLSNCENLLIHDSRQDIVIECSVDKETYKKLTVLHARNCIDSLSPYEYTLQRISELKLLFAKGVIDALYRSLDDKSVVGIESLLQDLSVEYPYPHEITLEDLTNHLCIQDTVFPITVLNAFLYERRNRWTLLKKCREDMNDGQIINAMKNRLVGYLEDKDKFFREGKEKKYSFSYNNLIKMYIALNSDPIKSAWVLLKKYEEAI